MARMSRTKFTPEEGKQYQNAGGVVFRCLSSKRLLPEGNATMQNIKTGWTFKAHGCGIYDDGTIDWDYSSRGFFM